MDSKKFKVFLIGGLILFTGLVIGIIILSMPKKAEELMTTDAPESVTIVASTDRRKSLEHRMQKLMWIMKRFNLRFRKTGWVLLYRIRITATFSIQSMPDLCLTDSRSMGQTLLQMKDSREQSREWKKAVSIMSGRIEL